MEAKILIVDDEPKNVELLEALLKPENYTLVKAENGKEALEYLSHNYVELILLDVMMPGMSGFDVLEEIRKSAADKAVPVIILTALKEREDRLKGLGAGADDFISKPFDKAELVFKVRTQVNLSLLRRQINEKEKLYSMMDLVLEGTAVTDENFNVQQINSKALDMLQLKELKGSLAKFILEKFGHDITKFPESSVFVAGRGETTSAPSFFFSIEYRRVEGGDGEGSSCVFVFKDVTDEHTRNRMKTDFLSLISHKLRTPLTVISGYSKMLESFASDEKLKDMAHAIVSSSQTMENLIKRILYFVEIENRARDGSDELLDIRAIMDVYSAEFKKPYELNLNQDEMSVKYWQKMAAEELISNAFKFNDKPTLELDVKVTEKSLIVEDNGPGMSETNRKKAFDSFYQGYRNSSGNTPGVGLGLSIVKRLAETAGLETRLEITKYGGLRVIVEKKIVIKPAKA
ncbi:MAG: hypothetical protein CVV21_04880 [Candidatus Goldiibacteriota bacterium HGW-Goldbacteria-1]|jgi:DNA-binding response OmpR family regulator/two-component sensor histidine kinase|nr:MAG: hypothetical protein CVV21_04880 [Candidatus Goldiibacteriota bacterium HGW-Goldbacteria-1]